MTSIHPLKHLINIVAKPSNDNADRYFSRFGPTPINPFIESNQYGGMLRVSPFPHFVLKPHSDVSPSLSEKVLFCEVPEYEFPDPYNYADMMAELRSNPTGGAIVFGRESEREELIRQYRRGLFPPTFSKMKTHALSMLVSRDGLSEVDFSDDEKWKVEEALMKTAVYGPDILPYYYNALEYYLNPDSTTSRVFDLDVNPDSSNFNRVIRESLFANERSLNLRTNFGQWTYAMRSTKLDNLWHFEKFIRQVNKPNGGGSKNSDFKYVRFSPLDKLKNENETYTVNDFPGPGIMVRGLHGNLFPEGHIQSRFAPNQGFINSSAEAVVELYNHYLVNNVNQLKNTTFVHSRGLVLVDNPAMMKIKGEEYSLIAFNDHFVNPTQRPAYLIPRKYVLEFLSDPLRNVGENHIFNPATFEARFKEEAIKINSLETLSGMCFGIPKESMLNFMVDQYCQAGDFVENNPEFLLSMHEDVLNAQFFAFSQLDLLNEGNRLYNLGYQYDQQHGYFTQDKFRMLREIVKWKTALEIPNERPVLFPYPLLSHSIDPIMVENCGFVDGNLVYFKDKSDGDFQFFDGRPPDQKSDNFRSSDVGKWRNMLGSDGLRKWERFLGDAANEQANLAVVSNQNGAIGKEILQLLGR
jgi:hypothetical protein